MYQKLRIVVASLVFMTLCILSSTATLAYFTDTDTKVNSFTVGNASTTLALYDDISEEPYRPFAAENYSPLTEGQEIPLFLQATNDGNIPVYQRFRIVIPLALADAIVLDLPNCTLDPSTGNTCANEHYTISYNPSVEIDHVPTYAEYYLTSNQVLDVNRLTAAWPTEKLIIGNIDNIDPSVFECTGSNPNTCALGISIHSDAVQTTGFPNALAAFANFPETY
ncbi:hypothetical protein IJI72_02870 [Candidatus Saccharibacteria bacterium]|nr:hypothetical protein [Candidatus Saccharibacteria bacterium]